MVNSKKMCIFESQISCTMTEDFLHYIWRYQKLYTSKLHTTKGEDLQIVNPGFLNQDAGPDFDNARIYINGQQWAGKVEIHMRSSDWYRHGHQHDAAYNGVILHVVYEHDKPVYRQNEELIPTLTLKGIIDENLYWRYEQLIQNQNFIPCENQLGSVDSFMWSTMLERVLVERLEQKSESLEKIVLRNRGNWNRSFFDWVCRSFGLPVNAAPMLQLARMIDENWIDKHRNNPLQIEALFLGVSGLLEGEMPHDYGKTLKKEFEFLKSKYHLRVMPAEVWKYARLRPPSFPDLRIAQCSRFLATHANIFATVLQLNTVKEIKTLFTFSMPDFWQNHYKLIKKSATHNALPGKNFQERFIINALVPFLFLYGRQKGHDEMAQKAFLLLEQLPFENNKVTLGFKQRGVTAGNTAQASQALLQLKKQYCDAKACLRCSIGNHLLKQIQP